METSKESYCLISNGTKTWYKNGTDLMHREDGPAYENGPQPDNSSVHREWWVNGELHREDGPAIIYSDGLQEFWYRNTRIMVSSLKEFQSYIKNKAFW